MVSDSRADQELKVVVLHPMQGDWNKWFVKPRETTIMSFLCLLLSW